MLILSRVEKQAHAGELACDSSAQQTMTEGDKIRQEKGLKGFISCLKTNGLDAERLI